MDPCARCDLLLLALLLATASCRGTPVDGSASSAVPSTALASAPGPAGNTAGSGSGDPCRVIDQAYELFFARAIDRITSLPSTGGATSV